MKETIHANIASQAFTLDVDAYQTLKSYLEEIQSCYAKEDSEVVDDIETRIAEIFREKLSSPMMVVTLSLVRLAIAQVGRPVEINGEEPKVCPTAEAQEFPRRLTRSRTDRKIAGVCGGLALFFGIDVTIIRIIMLILLIFGGASFWLYLILWLIVPEEPFLFSNFKQDPK
ncbi:MAG: PspC domain-containing protein [Alistipes sp.]